jgi:hypothetical protein
LPNISRHRALLVAGGKSKRDKKFKFKLNKLMKQRRKVLYRKHFKTLRKFDTGFLASILKAFKLFLIRFNVILNPYVLNSN